MRAGAVDLVLLRTVEPVGLGGMEGPQYASLKVECRSGQTEAEPQAVG